MMGQLLELLHDLRRGNPDAWVFLAVLGFNVIVFSLAIIAGIKGPP